MELLADCAEKDVEAVAFALANGETHSVDESSFRARPTMCCWMIASRAGGRETRSEGEGGGWLVRYVRKWAISACPLGYPNCP